MRLGLVVVCGCQAVFPLEAPPIDAPVDVPAGKPSISLETTGLLIGGKTAPIGVHAMGTPDVAVFYKVASPLGGFPASDSVVLGPDGVGIASVDWNVPLGPLRTQVSIDASYDRELVDPATDMFDAEVVQVFGQFDDQNTLVQVQKLHVFAHKITVSVGGRCDFGIVASGNGGVATALYAGTTGPTTKIVGTDAVLPSLAGRNQIQVSGALPAGDYWVAWMFENDLTIQGVGGVGTVMSNVAQGSFSSLPPNFPGASNDGSNYTAYLVIHPP